MDNPYLPLPCQILSVTRETAIDWTYRMAFPAPVNHGQFVEVTVPGAGECPISVSGSGDGWIDLTIRHIGRVTRVIREKKAGDFLFIRGPYGNGFDAANYEGRHVIIAAGGTGLAPVRSLITHLVSHPHSTRKLDILCGFKSPRDVLFREEVNAWMNTPHVNLILTVDRSDDAWACHTGFITDFVQHVEISDPGTTEVIIVGPPVMMSCTAREFQKLGITDPHIWVSFERNMSCGLGKCGHCKIDETYVCLEGPVFPYDRAVRMLD